MRLVCNGVALDLKSGATLSFKKVNPLFAFDALTCERTQSFDIPATPHNEAVFELSKLPAFYGTGMRRRFNCELQAGTVVKHGHLYVDAYTNGAYKGVFVTGELLGLQNIKGLGKLSEIIKTNETVSWQYGYVPDLPQRATDTWALTPYVQEVEFLHPSMRVADIVAKAVAQFSLAPITVPTEAEKLRIIAAEPKLLQPCKITFSRTYAAAYSDPVQVYPANIVNGLNATSETTSVAGLFGDTLIESGYANFRDGIQNWTLDGRVKHFVANQPLSITFPDDWPQTMYVGKIIAPAFYENSFEFYGNRSFTKTNTGGTISINRIGEPLAGRTIDLEAGAVFLFIEENDFLVYDSRTTTGTQGWKMNSNLTAVCHVEGKGEAAIGNVLRLQDNLPDVTLVELLKTIAAATGRVLNFTDAEGVTFDEVNTATWPTLNVTGKVTAETDLSRTFGAYAQRNIVEYKTDASVPQEQRVRTQYAIDNDNIEAESVLQTIPFTEGGQTAYGGYDVLQLAQDNETDALANADTPAKRMARVVLSPNAGIQQLCNASTSLTIKIRMTLAEYESIQAKTALLYNGTRYVWTEATWQNNVCTCKISKI